MRELTFTVHGLPAPKGSGRAYTYERSDAKGGGIGARVDHDNPKTKGWQQTIAVGAMVALKMPEHRACRFDDGPIYFEAQFYLPRPKALLTRTKAAQDIPHTKKPDLDKLIRAAKDALSKVVWTDDAQVVHVVARKRYCAAGELPRAVFRVRDAVAR